MPTQCVFTLNDVRCPETATHYLLRHIHEEAWTLETTPQRAYRLNGALSVWVLEGGGTNAVMHTPEFCHAHAIQVQNLRHAHTVVHA